MAILYLNKFPELVLVVFGGPLLEQTFSLALIRSKHGTRMAKPLAWSTIKLHHK